MSIRVHRLTPMAHVADVEASIRFYELFGFVVESRMQHGGRTRWAMLASREARLMLAASSGPIAPEQQAILFYLYSPDVATLRGYLLKNGLFDGGAYCGQAGPNDGRRVAFEITQPAYMEQGEFRVSDPDGYCLLIGQLTL